MEILENSITKPKNKYKYLFTNAYRRTRFYLKKFNFYEIKYETKHLVEICNFVFRDFETMRINAVFTKKDIIVIENAIKCYLKRRSFNF